MPPALLKPEPGNEGFVAGFPEGREGMEGRVDGLSPPDGRSIFGGFGIAGLVDGRFVFGKLTFGRPEGAGRLEPEFGILGRAAGRDMPPPPPPAIRAPPPPPPPPPPRNPRADS